MIQWHNGVPWMIFVIGTVVVFLNACECIPWTIVIDFHIDMGKIRVQTKQKVRVSLYPAYISGLCP